MNIRTIAFYIGLPSFILGLVSFQSNQDFELKEALLLKSLLKHIEQRHFAPVPIDDKYSEDVFSEYLERVDPGKRILLEEEVSHLSRYEDDLDDQLKEQRFAFFDESLDIIHRADERAKRIFDDVIQSEFKFDLEEYIENDANNLMYCESEEDLVERWRQMIKFQIIEDVKNRLDNQQKEDFDEEKKSFEQLVDTAREKLKKRWDRWFENRMKNRRVDWLSTYLNTVTMLNDPHTNYLKPQDKANFDMRMSNQLEGIGARLSQAGDYVKVVEVVPGGPAWKQGELKVDDQIIKVAQDGEDAVDVTGWHIDDVVSQIRGKKGSIVHLFVRRVDGSELEIVITRDIIVFDEGFARSYILDHQDFKDRVGYISLPSFYFDSGSSGARSCAEDVAIEIEKLKQEKVVGIILDLRDNGGGSLRDVVDMSGLFIEDGPIVQVNSRDQKPSVYMDQDDQVRYEGPLVILVNHGSASASEILAAAMQDYQRAVIIGSKTFGKGTVQRFYDLDRSIAGYDNLKPLGEVKISTQKFFRIDGGATQLEGVTPDIELPDPYQYFTRGERDYDHAMPWSEIQPAKYSQNVFDLSDLDEIVDRSQKRVAENPAFVRINEYAQLLKENNDITVYPLDFEAYSAFDDEWNEKMKQYEDLYPEIPQLAVNSLTVDLSQIASDSIKMERNQRFIDQLKKDIEVEESLAVIHDLITIKPGTANRMRQ